MDGFAGDEPAVPEEPQSDADEMDRHSGSTDATDRGEINE
jgi:hypothetical protein